jgi:hypothetical protein
VAVADGVAVGTVRLIELHRKLKLINSCEPGDSNCDHGLGTCRLLLAARRADVPLTLVSCSCALLPRCSCNDVGCRWL